MDTAHPADYLCEYVQWKVIVVIISIVFSYKRVIIYLEISVLLVTNQYIKHKDRLYRI